MQSNYKATQSILKRKFPSIDKPLQKQVPLKGPLKNISPGAYFRNFTVSASEARVGAERKISISFALKIVAFLPFAFPLPLRFLYSCSVFWSWKFTRPHFRGKRFGELKTYEIRRKEVQVVSGGFSSPFSAQRYIFFVFLSCLLDLIVLAFYSILFYYFATQNKLLVK